MGSVPVQLRPTGSLTRSTRRGTTVEEAQAAAVKLRERVEAARERRARGLLAGDDAAAFGGGLGGGSGSVGGREASSEDRGDRFKRR